MRIRIWLYAAGGLGAMWAIGKSMAAVEQVTGTIVAGFTNGVPLPIRVMPVGNGQLLRADAAKAFLAMQAAAKAAGIPLTATSGWRSMTDQTRLYAGYKAGLPGFNMAAAPGFSNHQGGISVDIGGIKSFASPAYMWLAKNARNFSFVNDVVTEYWHWTFK
jgi:hypothetical protein